MILGLTPLIWLVAVNWHNGRLAESQAEIASRAAAAWPNATQKQVLQQARSYNRRLAASGQRVIGGVYRNGDSGDIDFSGASDHAYQEALNGVQGIMGVIRIPRIGVTLPIRHGSGPDALNNGAGHLYGTSLPVGGRDTHAVITAHRGTPDRLLFTRLDELRDGDPFYLIVDGHTLAYKVTAKRTVSPQDTSHVRIVKNRDLVTLLTCTPYGVNTERLLVTGERTTMPGGAPTPDQAKRDPLPWLLGGAAILATLFIIRSFTPRHSGRHTGNGGRTRGFRETHSSHSTRARRADRRRHAHGASDGRGRRIRQRRVDATHDG